MRTGVEPLPMLNLLPRGATGDASGDARHLRKRIGLGHRDGYGAESVRPRSAPNPQEHRVTDAGTMLSDGHGGTPGQGRPRGSAPRGGGRRNGRSPVAASAGPRCASFPDRSGRPASSSPAFFARPYCQIASGRSRARMTSARGAIGCGSGREGRWRSSSVRALAALTIAATARGAECEDCRASGLSSPPDARRRTFGVAIPPRTPPGHVLSPAKLVPTRCEFQPRPRREGWPH